jgi:hypothetical protein
LFFAGFLEELEFDNLRVTDQDEGIDTIGLGELSEPFGEIADAAWIHDGDATFEFQEFGGQATFVAAGGFEDDDGGGGVVDQLP